MLFIAVAVAVTWPLASQLGTHIPGPYIADNVVFLWNFWLLRQALADPGATLLWTDAVYHPAGSSLVLHTHSLLNALPGATLLGRLTPLAALNLTILFAATMNGFATYLLAHRLTKARQASLLAGAFFASSPLFTAHLAGHFNYYTAWPLVLFVLAWWHARERAHLAPACLAGVLLAAVAYADYYYFIYAAVLALLTALTRAAALDVVAHRPRWTRTDGLLLVLAAIAATTALAVGASGGGVWHLAGVRISLTTGMNVRAVAAGALTWWLWRRRRLTPALGAGGRLWGSQARVLFATYASCLAVMAPLLWHALELWRAGHYVSQARVWRSLHPGLDPGAALLGNPFNSLWGDRVRSLHDALGMDLHVDPAWLGIVPLVLIFSRRQWMPLAQAREWLIVVGVFAVWALGPYLTIFGVATGLPLPQILLRYVPIVSNTRVPGHAMVMVLLGVAVLLAYAVSHASGARRRALLAAGVAVAALDAFSLPVETTRLEMPALYQRLAVLPPGAVLDVPFGIQDGSGESGTFEPRVLFFQTGHHQPITAGYVSRLSPGVRGAFLNSPALRCLMQLSARESTACPLEPAAVRDELTRMWRVRYVVLHEDLATPAAHRFVEQLALRTIDQDGQRRVYLLE